MNRPIIEEIIVVEGRDDTAAIRRAVDAVTIETHGFGIREETWALIEKAYHTKGIIVFTDPDTAGEQIRRRVLERFPDAKEAFLDQNLALKEGDIGIENASPESIREALGKVHRAALAGEAAGSESAALDHVETGAEAGVTARAAASMADARFTSQDLFRWGLDGVPGAAQRRRALGQKLGIGTATAKTFLQRLNRFGISRQEIENALTQVPEDPIMINRE